MENVNLIENEPELVEQAKTDDHAFEVLYNHYFPRIYGYVIKRVGNRETAEDLVSTTFMKVFINLKKYDHKGYTFGAWVYRIATNNLIDYYRKKGRTKEFGTDELPDRADERDLPEDYAQKAQDRVVVEKVLAKLNKRYQKILYYKFFAEFSHREISVCMKISESNARVMTHRALKLFYKKYKKYVK